MSKDPFKPSIWASNSKAWGFWLFIIGLLAILVAGLFWSSLRSELPTSYERAEILAFGTNSNGEFPGLLATVETRAGEQLTVGIPKFARGSCQAGMDVMLQRQGTHVRVALDGCLLDKKTDE